MAWLCLYFPFLSSICSVCFLYSCKAQRIGRLTVLSTVLILFLFFSFIYLPSFCITPAAIAHFTNGNFSGLVDLTPAQDFIAGLCLLIPSILFVNTSTNRHCCWDCDHTGKYAKIIQSRVIKFLPCFHRWDTPLIQSKCECKPNHPTCLAVQ